MVQSSASRQDYETRPGVISSEYLMRLGLMRCATSEGAVVVLPTHCQAEHGAAPEADVLDAAPEADVLAAPEVGAAAFPSPLPKAC